MKLENELTYASDSSGPGMVAPGQAQALISFVLALHLTAPQCTTLYLRVASKRRQKPNK